MAKLIIKNRFGQVPTELLNNPDISLKAKGIFAYLQSKPEDWDFSVERMVGQLKEGREALAAALKELEESGYLKRTAAKNSSGQWAGYNYELFINPLPVEPLTENPLTGNPYTYSKIDSSKIDISKIDNTFLANLLLAEILKNNPNFKEPNIDAWAEEIGLMIRRDARDPQAIEFIILWCQQDRFWKTNILSAAKLRKQFDQLMIKAKSDWEARKAKQINSY